MFFMCRLQSEAACPGLHDVARMENSTKAITAKLKTIIAIAPTSILESGAIRHFWWQSSGSVDLDHACEM
jgi:hypothetical protein